MRLSLATALSLLSSVLAAPSVFRDLFVLDCNSVIHAFAGTPFEVHVNLPALKWAVNEGGAELLERAQCMRNATCPQMSDQVLETLYVPSMLMLLNGLTPLASRVQRPNACRGGTSTTFASTFWDDTPLLSNLLGVPFVNLALPSSCNYATYASTGSCQMTFTEALYGQQLNLAVSTCPGGGILPYISLSVPAGGWANSIMHPCSTTADCGGGSLQCRTYGPDPTEFWDSLISGINLVTSTNPASSLSACYVQATALGGMTDLTRQLRNVLYTMFGLAPPPAYDANPIQVCFPTNAMLSAIGNRLVNGSAGAWTSSPLTSDASLIPAPGANPSTCLSLYNCAIELVGDGFCNMECFHPECRWDGGDCGHAPAVWPPVPTADPNIPSYCFIDQGFAGVTNGSVNPSTIRFNVWEPCNGVGTCNLPYCYNYGGGPQYCSYPSPDYLCSCNYPWSEYLLPGFNSPGPRCEYVQQQSMFSYLTQWGYENNPSPYSQLPAGTTGLFAVRAAGGTPSLFGTTATRANEYALPLWSNALSAWNGVLADGSSVLSPDRISGALSPTPPLFTDVGEPSLPGFWMQLVHATCSGEVGVRVGNDNIGVGIASPLLRTLPAAVYAWVQNVTACRALTLGVPPLTPAQFEARFGVSHLAYWLYQYVAMNTSLLSWSTTGFGSQLLPDWLLIPQEPILPAPASYAVLSTNASADPRNSLKGASYASSGRIGAPSVDCSFDSAAMLGTAAGGDRRCRFSYSNLGGAVTPPGWAPVPLNLYAEARHDTCGGAPLGPSSAFTGLGSSTLSPANAAMGPPSGALYVDSALLTLLSSPTPCQSNSDCIGLGGGALVCYDMVSQLFGPGGIAGSLPGRVQDPVAILTAGFRADGANPGGAQQCTGATQFRASIRDVVRSLRSDSPSSDGSSALQMCLPPIEDLVQAAPAWVKTWGTGCNGTCLKLPATPFFPAAAPATVNGAGPFPLPYSVRASPDAADGLYAAFSADARVLVPGVLSAGFVISLVPTSPATVTNDVKSKLRRALALGLSMKGYPVSHTDVYLGGAAASVYVASAGAIDVPFTVVLPPGASPTTLANLISELTGGGAGTLGSLAGPYMASMGVVTSANSGSVVIHSTAIAPSASSSAASSTSPGASPSSTLASSPSVPASATSSLSSAASPSVAATGTPVPTVSVSSSLSHGTTPSGTPLSTPSASQTITPTGTGTPTVTPPLTPPVTMVVSFAVSAINGSVAMQMGLWFTARAAISCGLTGGALQPTNILLVSVIDLAASDLSVVLETDVLNVGAGPCPPARRQLAPALQQQQQQRRRGLVAAGGAQYTLAVTIPPGVSGTEGASGAAQAAAQQQVATTLAFAFNTTAQGKTTLHNALAGAGFFAAAAAASGAPLSSITATGAGTSLSDSIALPPGSPAPAPGSSSDSSSSTGGIVAGVVVGLAIIGAVVVAVVALNRRSRNTQSADLKRVVSSHPQGAQAVVDPGADNPMWTPGAPGGGVQLRVAYAAGPTGVPQ